MARCKDCFHWEACKEMYEAMGNSLPGDFSGSAERCNTFVPSADVVPKSEIDELKTKLEGYRQVCGEILIKNGVTVGLLDGKETVYIPKSIAKVTKELAIRSTKQEVAREIFEEIDRMCIDTFGNFNHRVFAELKKKHIKF